MAIILIVAARVVPNQGAGRSLVGLSSGTAGGLFGIGDFGALDTVLSYTWWASALTWRCCCWATPKI